MSQSKLNQASYSLFLVNISVRSVVKAVSFGYLQLNILTFFSCLLVILSTLQESIIILVSRVACVR